MTQTCIPNECVPQTLNMDECGDRLYEGYVTERINENVCLWSSVKKVNNKMFLSGSKMSQAKIREKTVDMKETRKKTRKKQFGNYEFTLTP